MNTIEAKLGLVESRFADIIWAHAPMTTRELIVLCKEELNWARTTTYTVLKKLCLRGIFHMHKCQITVLIPRDEFYAIQSEQFVDKNFSGSLPAFVAAFASRKPLSEKELDEVQKLLDSYRG